MCWCLKDPESGSAHAFGNSACPICYSPYQTLFPKVRIQSSFQLMHYYYDTHTHIYMKRDRIGFSSYIHRYIRAHIYTHMHECDRGVSLGLAQQQFPSCQISACLQNLQTHSLVVFHMYTYVRTHAHTHKHTHTHTHKPSTKTHLHKSEGCRVWISYMYIHTVYTYHTHTLTHTHTHRPTHECHRGAAFGLAHTMQQLVMFRPPNRDSRITNLFFVGASTTPGESSVTLSSVTLSSVKCHTIKCQVSHYLCAAR
jgi:hypothetical protein